LEAKALPFVTFTPLRTGFQAPLDGIGQYPHGVFEGSECGRSWYRKVYRAQFSFSFCKINGPTFEFLENIITFATP
jgi:hypothetical protein